MPNVIHLKNRSLISVKGEDRKTFLQSLISGDVNKVEQGRAIYATMLNPQGRFLYDFFITEFKDQIVLDCSLERVDEIVKKLTIYKLRAGVQIEKMSEEFSIFATIKDNLLLNNTMGSFPDPRNSEMGFRIIAKKEELLQLVTDDLDFYNNHRLNLRIADDSDLTYDKSFILEFGFDDLNAVDYEKGCYIGQEVTARTHYRGQVRKKVCLLRIGNLSQIEKESEITCDDKKMGIVLSSVFYDEKLLVLALIKNIDNSGNKIDLESLNLEVSGHKITYLK